MFGDLARTHRRRVALTQEELAALTGISDRQIRGIEAGRTAQPRMSTVRLLAGAFRLEGPDLERFLAAGSPPEDSPGNASSPTVPSLLPADVAAFAGRGDEIQRVAQLFDPGSGAWTAVPVVSVIGRPGVGKTALAVHVAHLLRERFPDGQLYVDLRGAGPQPLAPADVLARFLRALGVDAGAVPRSLDERAELYRGELADRRLLVVLDDAQSESQILPLLPGSPSCAALVTGRRYLGGQDRHTIRLDVLQDGDALALLGGLVGESRMATDPGAGRDVVRLCGRLPLALRIAGGRLARLPHRSLRWLADRLDDDRRRLDELATDHQEVRASFQLSYDGLSAPARLLLGRLGRLEAAHVPSWGAAALLGIDDRAVDDYLDELVDTNLLDVAVRLEGDLRYSLHDLVRLFARERAELDDTSAEGVAALHRALWTWHRRAAAADETLTHGFPRPLSKGTSPSRHPAEAAVGVPAQPRPDRQVVLGADALAWFEGEHPALVSGVRQAFDLGEDELCWHLASRLTGFFEIRGHLDDWKATHEVGLRAARRARSVTAEAALLHRLGELYANRDEYERALELFDGAREALHGAPPSPARRRIEAHVLRSRGVIERAVGRVDEARVSLETALTLFAEQGDSNGVAHTEHGLGAVHLGEARLEEAAESYSRALQAFETSGDLFQQALVACSLGVAQKRLGRRLEAKASFTRSLDLSRRVGHRPGEVYALRGLGDVEIEEGRLEQAALLLEQARALSEELGERYGQALAWSALGALHQRTGDLDAALGALTAAQEIWAALGVPHSRAQLLESIGNVQMELGRPAAAHAAWRKALMLFRDLGVPEAEALARRIRADNTTTVELHADGLAVP